MRATGDAVPVPVNAGSAPSFQIVADLRLLLLNGHVTLQKKIRIPEKISAILQPDHSRCRWQDSFWKLPVNKLNPEIRQ